MNTQISKEDREKIASVVETTFKAASEGKDPTETLASEATKEGLTVDQTKRAAEATNVSITLAYNKTASAEDRARSDFEIVSPDAVLDKMFPKKANKREIKYPEPSESSYELCESKEASLSLLDVEPDYFEISEEALYKKASDSIRKGESVLEEVRNIETSLLHKSEECLSKIASMVDGLYGDTSASIEDIEIREYVNEMISKSASEQPAKEPSSLLSQAVNDLKSLLKQASDQSSIVEAVEEELNTLKKLSADMLSGNPADGPIPTNIGTVNIAGMVNPAIGAFLRTRTQNPGAQRQIKDNFRYNPFNDEAFRDVVQTREMLQNAVMLSNLINEDEVLKNADPKKVINSFNDIFSGMPQLANNPELTRSALRYAVEYGGMDFPTMIGIMKDVNTTKATGTLKSTQSLVQELAQEADEKGSKKIKDFEDTSNDVDQRRKDNFSKDLRKIQKGLSDLKKRN